MAEEGVFLKRGGALWPADPVAGEIMRGLGQGKLCLVGVRVPRSIKQNRWIHWFLTKVLDNTDRFHDLEDLRDFLKIRSRMFRLRIMPDGSTVLELQSVSFGSMDQLIFQRVVNRWLWIVEHEILPDIDDTALRNEILLEITDDREAAFRVWRRPD
jgi:hypothetical protein